jgi:hypothetical protein
VSSLRCSVIEEHGDLLCFVQANDAVSPGDPDDIREQAEDASGGRLRSALRSLDTRSAICRHGFI